MLYIHLEYSGDHLKAQQFLLDLFSCNYVIGYVYECMVNKGTYFFKRGWTSGGAFPYKTC